ncbi:hypothetical protein Cs7R123_70530 [Catellatospora sp. TT07R-123]|uniref:DUF3046 domain-containing protein n=1 Tax=Catellatospora sp. TT07R-123 TaxID=2733863 RepID=UPI001B155D6B|nr:DUF3046 domain-containing protein [Catellatospora sp. TT07R-123]GHJ49711.1 hypothetical protein Cs7R123_70530 [Catellatospora sp. TT07R-123]
MRRTDFWERLGEVFGPVYATSVAKDQVFATLGGRTIDRAMAEGEEVHVIWRAVVEQYSDRVPARLR